MIRSIISKIILFGIVYIVIFAILFFWNEHLSIGTRINDQKITNFILIITASITATSVLILARQLEEQRISRLASVLPEIYPRNFQCQLTESEHIIGGKAGLHIAPKDYHFSSIQVDNIGVGTAKEINTEWIYNENEVDELIKGTYTFFAPMKRGDDDHLNFLKKDETGLIYLPFYYLLCCGIKLNLASVRSGSDGHFGIKPSLKLKMKYLDVNNQKFEKIFNVDVQAYGDVILLKFK